MIGLGNKAESETIEQKIAAYEYKAELASTQARATDNPQIRAELIAIAGAWLTLAEELAQHLNERPGEPSAFG